MDTPEYNTDAESQNVKTESETVNRTSRTKIEHRQCHTRGTPLHQKCVRKCVHKTEASV